MADEDGAGRGGGLRGSNSQATPAPSEQEHQLPLVVDRDQRIAIPLIDDGYVREELAIPALPGAISEIRESVRGEIAKHILWTFNAFLLATALIITTARWTGVDIASYKDFFDPVLSAVVAIISATVGFYFGKETSAIDKSGAEG